MSPCPSTSSESESNASSSDLDSDHVAAQSSDEGDQGPTMEETIRAWIATCDQRHGCFSAGDSSSDGPQWVIDTKEACIIPGSQCSRYVALSYRWGAHGSFFLMSENLADVQTPGFLDLLPDNALPLILLEAMDFVQSVGERYLWIDRLCVVQDRTDAGDSDVHVMDSIYAGAYLTVIAAGSPDKLFRCRCWEGNRTNRQDEDESESDHETSGGQPTPLARPRVLHSNRCRREWTETRPDLPPWARSEPADVDPKDVVKSHYTKLLASDWARRGWTFQEQILSRRCVVFLENSLFWDCQSSVWDAKHLTPESEALTTSSVGNFSDMATRVSSTVIPDFPLYLELVCLYNNRDLTYTGDGLRAMAGVLQHFCRSYPGGLVGGLPNLFFDAALLWQPVTKAERRGQEDNGQLPSWSWCGWKCPVDPTSLVPGLEGYEGSHANTYCIRNLVQWSVSSDDGSEEEITEPAALDECKRFNPDVDSLRDGWVPSIEIASKDKADDSSVCSSFQSGHPEPEKSFSHSLDPARRRFKFPFPTGETPATTDAQIRNLAPRLACVTTSANFGIGALYTPKWYSGLLEFCAVVKTSVFDLPLTPKGSPIDDICRVVSLVDAQGNFAGAVRLMGDGDINLEEPLELIAVSTGFAECDHVFAQREERILGHGYSAYEGMGKAVYFERRAVTGEVLCQEDTEHGYEAWKKANDKGKTKNESGKEEEQTMDSDEEGGEETQGHSDKGDDEEVKKTGDEEAEQDPEGESDDVNDEPKKGGQEDEKVSSSGPRPATPDFFKWFEQHQERNRVIREAWFRTAEAMFYRSFEKGSTYEFYNVLWIERRDGLAYRKGAGRVAKTVWEANCGEKAQVVLA
ncbi:heterokaryon incompatibility protein-domain-containing protein [Echria macrotheca]|uniref:Heterokaryon incompatibility protein-domain-containing protein n=1 Tax=Echria macrotheca TaxID=438768 RepID=A0AAJ0BEN5_9PEZI|nr:heterokaryon incompatibility protein-domain-containing protein [Echria macrotheca]